MREKEMCVVCSNIVDFTICATGDIVECPECKSRYVVSLDVDTVDSDDCFRRLIMVDMSYV